MPMAIGTADGEDEPRAEDALAAGPPAGGGGKGDSALPGASGTSGDAGGSVSPRRRGGGKVGGMTADSGAPLPQQYVTATPHTCTHHSGRQGPGLRACTSKYQVRLHIVRN